MTKEQKTKIQGILLVFTAAMGGIFGLMIRDFRYMSQTEVVKSVIGMSIIICMCILINVVLVFITPEGRQRRR
jgi:hypothetical protein